jgi:monofunctional biosynthetic peptidoglycan transglycosylase
VIASEDATFCAHAGFDMKAIEKALKTNARVEDSGRGKIRGGSTISQQTAKNVFLWPGRDWVRKGLEAGYTV